MKIKLKRLLILLLILFSVSCARTEEKSSFVLNGRITNAPDKSLIYIQTKDFIDSTEITKERFTFTGKVGDPTRAVIYMKNGAGQNRFFWLENSSLAFEGEMDDLAGSKMTGGHNQEASNLFEDSRKHIRRSMDSIAKVLNRHQSDFAKDSTLAFYKKLVKEEDEIEQKFICEYPNSWEAISILNQNMTTWSAPKVKTLFSQMSSKLQNSSYGKSINGYINKPKIGDKYVDFEQRNTDGQSEKFSDHMGRYTLLEFWASWCLPCRKSNPKLVELFNKYSHHGFTVVGISIDENEENWLEAIRQDELPWVNLNDLKGDQNEPYIVYGVNAIPDNILLDENGIIVGRNLTMGVLEERLAEIFK